jgi:hypothetical protein
MHAAAPIWRNGRRNGLKIVVLAISLLCEAYQNLAQFTWVNRPNLRISSVYQRASRNRLTLAQILVHRAGGESAGPK